MTRFFTVGGCIRDEILGLQSKDIDFAVEAESFSAMREEIIQRGGEIFLETPQYLTIRARVPELGCSDFVLCRKDGEYHDSRHPDSVEPGSLFDDLSRRDFTCNALAKSEGGEIIDYFGGQLDIKRKLIRCVGDPRQRFSEDALRLLRAMRFSITKGMTLNGDVEECLLDEQLITKLTSISIERVREEMQKMFCFDTLQTLKHLEHFHILRDVVFSMGDLHLEASLKKS